MWPIYGILAFKWIQLKNDFECAAEPTDKSLEQFVGLHFTFQRIPQEEVERTNKTRYMAERVGGQRSWKSVRDYLWGSCPKMSSRKKFERKLAGNGPSRRHI